MLRGRGGAERGRALDPMEDRRAGGNPLNKARTLLGTSELLAHNVQ